MRKFLFAALAAALLCPLPARSQQQTTGYAGRGPYTTSGTLTTTNDAVTADLSGSMWATARWAVTTAGTATVTTEVSIDGGTNWFASAYSKNITVVSANPSVAPWANNGPVAGIYETPLPGNATHFRVRCGNTGTATVVAVGAGAAATPGVPVTATLYDVTSAVNTLNATGVLDMSGWNGHYVSFSSGGATTVALLGAAIADDGFFVAQATPAAYTNGGGSTVVAAATSGIYSSSRLGGPTAVNAFIPTRRVAFSLAAVAAQATRLRVEVYR